MILSRITKNAGIAVLTMGLMAGCAMTQKQNEPAEPAQVKKPAPAPVPAPAPAPMPEPAADIMYTVERGDNLWSISGKGEVYGDPYQWPLIYKANSDQIKDADLIFPGQEFTINVNVGSAEVAAAVNHARTRGAWSLGVTEDSDKDYLAR
jgi:LysM repeat protein